jgi:hypothetical protein
VILKVGSGIRCNNGQEKVFWGQRRRRGHNFNKFGRSAKGDVVLQSNGVFTCFEPATQIVNPSMLGVTLNIRMVTWKYLNFQIKVRLNSRVFAIEEKIRQHHGGSVHDVFLYNGVVSPENLLNDPSLTLFEAGFEGDIEGSEPEQDVWCFHP